jgi:hypothetical protein
MESSIAWILVFTRALRAHFEVSHSRTGPIVWQCVDDRIARTAVSASYEKVVMPSVALVTQLLEAIVTYGDVWGDDRACMNPCHIALEDSKLVELSRIGRVRYIDLMYSAGGRSLSLKLCHESGDGVLRAFDHDLNAGITKIANESDKPVRGCDSIDEGSEPYPLNDALDEKSSPRCSSPPIHAGAARFGN